MNNFNTGWPDALPPKAEDNWPNRIPRIGVIRDEYKYCVPDPGFIKFCRERDLLGRKRYVLFINQRGFCFWCGMPMIGASGRLSPTVDHLEPKTGYPRRTVAAHSACNSARHHDAEVPPHIIKEIEGALKHVKLFTSR